MSNHGQVAFEENLYKAFELAQEVENICHQYVIALKMEARSLICRNEENFGKS